MGLAVRHCARARLAVLAGAALFALPAGASAHAGALDLSFGGGDAKMLPQAADVYDITLW